MPLDRESSRLLEKERIWEMRKSETLLPVPTEHEEQKNFFEWAQYFLPEDLRPLLFAIPNGGHRNKIVGAKLKAEGVKKGVPDMFFAWPRLGKHGLWIEMKRIKHGYLSKDQREMVAALREAGYQVEVCKGFDAAKTALTEYMLGFGSEEAA